MGKRVNKLLETVINNDYCIGCGICASVDGSPFEMKLNEDGKYVPVLKENGSDELMQYNLASVCPFSDESSNETDISKKLYKDVASGYDDYSGYYIKTYAGYVEEDDYRELGSSGGMGNWIAAQLLDKGFVDGIIHVKESPDHEATLFKYGVSSTINDLKAEAKSKYYPIEMSEVMEFIKENKGTYALIGIPCFIKSVRLLSEHDNIIKGRIKYTIGLVCGHLKSDMFAKSMGWQLGIEPNNLTNIDFRKKLPDRPANSYGVEVQGLVDGKEKSISSPTKDLYVTNWGQGYFKYNACEFCDDVLAETADVTVGDAWLPQYSKDSMGTNVVVTRHPDIQAIFDNAGDRLYLDEIDASDVYKSQAGGFRHRRDGLAHRLQLKDEQGQWRPKKRVNARDIGNKKRKKIYERRGKLSEESFKAFKIAEEADDFNKLMEYMDPFVKEYNKVNKSPLTKRAINKVKRTIKSIIEN